ncbi:MAG: hypothetical protein AAFV85_04245 [Cyanobacteria bacterium J06634_6]
MQASDLTVKEQDITVEEQDSAKVSSLTVGELKLLIKETVSETLKSLLVDTDLIDPDFGKQIRPEFVAKLREAMQQNNFDECNSASAVAEELGFNWNEL